MSGEGTVDYLPWRAPEVEDSRSLRPVDAEAARKLAWEQGYADGYNIGVEAGTRDARQRMGYLHEILEALARPFRDLDESVSAQICELVRALTRQLVRKEVALDSETVCRVIDEALTALPVAETPVSIIVNPDDAEFVNTHLADDTIVSWNLATDAGLARGDCRLVADLSRIDATLDTRLDRLIEQMITEGDDAAD